MTKQITLEEALELVTFHRDADGIWWVEHVYSSVKGNVVGNVHGNVVGYVHGNVVGNVVGTIAGLKWEFVETPEEKLWRLISETGNQELIDAFNQLHPVLEEDN